MGPDAGTKYLVCNADEMEPGTFKDRLLMEQVPHQLIEAMLIAGYAIQATTGYIFLRGEYVTAAKRLNRSARRRARGRLRRREHPRQSVELRALRAHRRRPLHLRRRNRADQLSRGAPRDAARETAVPADRGPLGTADDRQQRRDAVEPAAHRRERRGLVQRSVATARARTAARRCTAAPAARPSRVVGNCRSARRAREIARSTRGRHEETAAN